MKTLYWAGAFLSSIVFFTVACAPKTSNYKMVHMDSENAQQSLNQSIRNHP